MDALHSAPPRPVERPRVVAVGTAVVAGSVAMFFATLLVVYWLLRAQELAAGNEWLAECTIPDPSVRTGRTAS